MTLNKLWNDSGLNEIIEKLDNAVLSNNDIDFGDIDSDIVTFFSNDIGLNSINLNNINRDKNNFDDCDPKTINHIRLMTWYNRFKQHNGYKKQISKELMPTVWHPTRWWDCCVLEDEIKNWSLWSFERCSMEGYL